MSALVDYEFTSESVAAGHPDKVCDAVSDAVLDAFLTRNALAKVAVECLATTQFLCIAGEVRGVDITPLEIETIARQTVRDIGYEQDGFHWHTMAVDVRLHQQSLDIARGVEESMGGVGGAGDQGMMFGYAVKETPTLMPAAQCYAHAILENLNAARQSGAVKGLGPDAKSQVTVVYRNRQPVGVSKVVLSTQHDEALSQDDVRALVTPIIQQTLPAGWLPKTNDVLVNPTGRFVIGGPDGDSGLTGRKITVDSYGGAAPSGGGAFSGKDPSKVDRSAAYMARYIAKNIVAADLAEACTLQLAYAIGVAEPVSVYLDLRNPQVDAKKLTDVVRQLLKLTPHGIRQHLQLNRPIYLPTAAYGHFGRTPTDKGHFSWEKTDLVASLRQAFGA